MLHREMPEPRICMFDGQTLRVSHQVRFGLHSTKLLVWDACTLKARMTTLVLYNVRRFKNHLQVLLGARASNLTIPKLCCDT